MLLLNRYSTHFKAGIFAVLFSLSAAISSAQLTVPNNTACPNQVVSATATWPNVSITSLTLVHPIIGNINLGTNPTFTFSHPGPGTVNFTLNGTGISNSGTVAASYVFQLTIPAPPPLTFTNQVNYCPGSTATIIAEPGGSSYSVSGTANLGSFPTNVILIPNLTAANSGTYLVQSIGACTLVGTATVLVAPNNPLTVTAPTNACQGASDVYLQATMPGGNFLWEFQSSPIGNVPLITVATNPTNSGVYTVTGSFQFGNVTCSKSATTTISIVQTGKPNLTASPGTAVCNGEKLGLQADANFATGYSWTGPCGFASGIKSPTISPAIPCHTGWYKATAFFSNGMITCTELDSIKINVIPTESPKVTVPPSACQHLKVSMVASTTQSVLSWVWYGPNFTVGSNTTTPTSQTVSIDSVKPINSGPYIVTAVFGLTGVAKTCSVSSQPQQLQVIEVKTVQVIPSPPVCTPDNAQLAASAPGALEFHWEGPNNQKYNGSNITVYYPTPSYSGVYTVTALFGNLKCPSSNTVQLDVFPTLEFDLWPMRNECWGDSILLQGPAGADSYSWTSSTGFKANTKNVIINSLQAKDAGTYTVTVKLGPCITKSSTQVNVRAPIVWTLTPNDRTICKGDTVVLEVGTNYDPDVAIEWNPELYLPSKVGPRQVVAPLGTIQYNVKAWDYGCDSPYSIQHTFFIEVLPVPQPTLNLKASRGCVPFTQRFNSSIFDSAAMVTFDFGGLNQKIQMDSLGVMHTFTEPGTYSVYVITKAFNQCSERWKYPFDIIVDPKPGSDFSWEPNPATTSTDVEFKATSIYEPLEYRRWFFNGGKPVGESGIDDLGGSTDSSDAPKRIYPQAGRYPVMLVSQNDLGCTDTVVRVVPVIDEMLVYIPDAFTPNGDGVNDEFFVTGQGLDPTGFLMYIFNRKGGLIFTSNDVNEHWDGTYKGEKCQDGIYTYKIRIVGLNGEGRKDYVGRVALIK